MAEGADNTANRGGERHFTPNAAHLIRTTQQIHVSLSQMADQKASILMGATFVIFTITIGQAHNGHAALPLLILGGFAFFSAVFAILAVLPATRVRGSGPVNLLFFGSFVRLDEGAYVEQLLDTMSADESVYRAMAQDIYQNGAVLARKKYRLLGYAYRILLAGLTCSALAFVWGWPQPSQSGTRSAAMTVAAGMRSATTA